MSLGWRIVAFIIVMLVFANHTAKNYYDMIVTEFPKEHLRSFIVKSIVPPVAYMGFTIYVYYFNGGFQKTIFLKTLSIENLDLSSSNTQYENLGPAEEVAFGTSIGFVNSFYIPLVFFAKLAFAVFGGTGMALLPLRLIETFVNRPKQPEPFEHTLAKKVLNENTNDLIDQGRQAFDLKRDIDMNTSEDPQEKETKMKILVQKVYDLKREFIEFEQFFEAYQKTDNILDSNPLVYWSSLLMGFVAVYLSLILIIHTVLTISGVYGFLEKSFIFLDRFSIILSLFLFLLFALYLCAAVVYGTINFTYILTWILSTHPIKIKNTWTDSFLININFSILGTFGMLLFVSNYCRDYLRFIDSDTFFNKILSRTGFIHILKKNSVFEYMMLLFFLLSIFISVFLLTGPIIMNQRVEKKKLEIEKEKQKLIELERNKTSVNFA
jgi:hypothetical protein